MPGHEGGHLVKCVKQQRLFLNFPGSSGVARVGHHRGEIVELLTVASCRRLVNRLQGAN